MIKLFSLYSQCCLFSCLLRGKKSILTTEKAKEEKEGSYKEKQ